ncbi:hypothetical protein [Streptomyces sp. NBC_01451]|uniref:hypothetical protein n=1 Tax=Streptomyces sp. NBC_01451 TaxID=2903872 RepID=UPI002E33ECAA|nr:hypothetical protein [Streptomyces sp. NBC_01451]
MAIVHDGCLKCPRCGEYVIEADEEQYPNGVDYRTPGADESKTPCGECAPHVQGTTETRREPTDTRPIPIRSVRWLQKPRWAAYYEHPVTAAPKTGRRRVGLLVPRPTPQSPNGVVQVAYAYNGTLMEFPVGSLPEGPSGWYTARAGELTREEQKAIRAFANNRPEST